MQQSSDSVAVRVVRPESTPRAAAPVVARDTNGRLTFDSLPETARIALRFDVRAFRRYRLEEYDQKFRNAYRLSTDDGLYIVRANLQGIGRTDYVVAGRNGPLRSVLAVMRRTDTGGWTVRSVAVGEMGSLAPRDSASVWIRRAEKGHPNGQWDAVVVRRLYQSGAGEVFYYWDANRNVFFTRKRSQ